jgi:hypothetical protein
LFSIEGRRIKSLKTTDNQEIRMNLKEVNAEIYLPKLVSKEGVFGKKLVAQ